MINKFYEKIKQFMKETYLLFLFYLVLIATLTYPLPFYIYTGGGAIDTSSRVKIEGETKSEGSLHFLYVSQLNATIPTYLLAHLLPSWDIESIQDYQITEEETLEEMVIRDKLYLEDANASATFTAYQHAGKTIQIHGKKNSVIYLQDRTKTNLKIGDVLLSVEGEKIEDIEDVRKIVSSKNVGDRITFQVERDQKEITCYADVFLEETTQKKYIGISFLTTYDYDLEPSMELNFQNNESGPSGGLMLALTIYDKLVEEDITHGLKIVGTGTIDRYGNVGTIGGVKYKLRGAVANDADVMLVPMGENYEECKKIQEEEDLDIQIIGVRTFQEALDQLASLS